MLNNPQARVIDPILSTHARGYRQAGFIGERLFPRASVPAYAGKVIVFGKEAFKAYNTKRAPGGATKRVEFGYTSGSYAIIPGALEAKVPIELMRDASAVPGINLATRAVNLTQRAMLLEHEVACATLATTAGNYDSGHKVTLTGTDRWTAAASDPSGDVETGREAIRQTIGVYPNTLAISAKAMSALRFNPSILDRFKHTSIQSVTIDMLKTLWEIPNIVVGQALASSDADVFSDVWGADAVLGYVSDGGDAGGNVEEPSYGYTYVMEGHPMVEAPYWDPNTKSWIYGVSYDNTPVLSGMTGGYLIKDAGL